MKYCYLRCIGFQDAQEDEETRNKSICQMVFFLRLYFKSTIHYGIFFSSPPFPQTKKQYPKKGTTFPQTLFFTTKNFFCKKIFRS